MIIVITGSGTVTNINTALPLSGGPITTSGTITTSMATNKLIGRSTVGTGTMEEITVGTGLSLTGGTLSSTGGGAAGNTNEIQFNNAAAFAASGNLRWIIADNRLLLGSENTADINSRMVVIGKGISTQNTFVVHNSTGTNNSLVVRDDGRVGIGTNAPSVELDVNGRFNFIQTNNGRGKLSFINNTGTGNFLTFNYSALGYPAANMFTAAIAFNTVGGNNYHGEINLSRTAPSALLTTRIGASGLSYLLESNIALGTTSNSNGSKLLIINNGTPPTNNVTESFQQYSANISGAGTAAPHFRTENGSIIKLYQETTAVTGATYVSGSGGNIKEDCTFDGYTVAQIVKALKNQGLLS